MSRFASCCLDCVPGPGLAPAGDLLFFASPKKSRQKKGDPTVCDPFALRRGNLRCSRFAGSRPNSLRSDKGEPLSAKRCAPRRSQRGGESARAFASLGLVLAVGSSEAERSDGLFEIPSGCAEERRRRRDQGRSCLSGTKCSEFCGPPPESSTAGCPKRSVGTQTAGSPFLWLLSFGEAKESSSPAGARPGLRPPQGEPR
ncbi:hypothetical protein J2W35_006070 [Variovorax boronicumulans]|nr:hypothetical protein [Variovorax boronicumulans]